MEVRSQYVTIKEAAELLGVTPTTLRNWDKTGKLIAERDLVNGYRLYRVEDISRILQERNTQYVVATPVVRPAAYQLSLLPSVTPATLVADKLDTRTLRLLVRQMSRAFRDSMGGGILERFEEISKLLYCKLYDEKQIQTSADYEPSFHCRPEEQLEEVYQRICSLYQKAISLLPDVFVNGHQKLSEDKRAVVKIVEILQNIYLNNIPADVKGAVYEELVRNTFEKSENQQFFTPRPVVEFMIQFINPQPGEVLCDPACGSGGFLTEAANHISQIFNQEAQGSVETDRLVEYMSNNLLGLEIDKRMAWVAQMNLIMHGDGQGNIHYLKGGGSLAFSEQLDKIIAPNSIDLILTNPPFGSDFSDRKDLLRYKLGRGKSSRRRGILFIERCIHWLKPGGRIGIIIEDSVLNGISNEDVRDFILQYCLVEAVISLPDVTFMPYATAKASILFLRKRMNTQEIQPPIFMASVTQVGRKQNGDPLYADFRDNNGRPVLLNDLPSVIEAWQAFNIRGEKAITHLSPKVFICSPNQFHARSDRQQGLRLDVQFHHPSRKVAEDALHRSLYPTPKLAELVVIRNITAVPASQDPDEIWHYIGLANITAETGEYSISEVTGSQLKSAVRLFKSGDILFSKLRPELRKCILIQEDEDDGFVSSECLVFCTIEKAMNDPSLGTVAYKRQLLPRWQVDSEYLAFILRSDIIFGQLVYQITGVGRPRVSQAAILGLQIPLPPLSIQREVVAAYKQAWKHYLACRKHSEMILQEANATLKSAYTYANDVLCPK